VDFPCSDIMALHRFRLKIVDMTICENTQFCVENPPILGTLDILLVVHKWYTKNN